MKRFLHKLIHFWEVVREHREVIYKSCSYCGERRAHQKKAGIVWFDQKWLKTGVWTDGHES